MGVFGGPINGKLHASSSGMTRLPKTIAFGRPMAHLDTVESV